MIDPVQVLKDAVQKAGSQKAFASNVGVSPQYVNDLMRGRRASLHTQGVPSYALSQPLLFPCGCGTSFYTLRLSHERP